MIRIDTGYGLAADTDAAIRRVAAEHPGCSLILTKTSEQREGILASRDAGFFDIVEKYALGTYGGFVHIAFAITR